MQPLLNSRFNQFQLDEGEEKAAVSVNPYTFAYIQNKVAAYANAVVEFQYDVSKDITAQVIEHEKLKAQVIVLEELMRELNPPIESQSNQSESKSE